MHTNHFKLMTIPENELRSHLSFVAWIMCGLCAWVMFVAAYAEYSANRHYETEHTVSVISE
jgi:hypothetical protein